MTDNCERGYALSRVVKKGLSINVTFNGVKKVEKLEFSSQEKA